MSSIDTNSVPAPPVTPSSVMVPKPKSSVVLAVVDHHDGGRIERRIGIDANYIAVSKAQVGDFIVAEVGGSVVAEIVRVGARTACLHIIAETAVEDVGAIAAVQLVIARAAVQDVVACVA